MEVEKAIPELEALKRQMTNLCTQLDRAPKIIPARDNYPERLDKDQEKLEETVNGVRQRMQQVRETSWREGVLHSGTDARRGRELRSQTVTKQGRFTDHL